MVSEERGLQTAPVKIKVEKLGGSSFRLLKVDLDPGQQITVEPGAMASQDSGIEIETIMNGSFLKAFMARYFGGESFFINVFRNESQKATTLYLTQTTPGDIIERELQNEELFIEAGSFIARTRNILTETVWAGFASWLAGEGLFRLKVRGTGRIWFGCYGSIVEKEIDGDYIVDSGHLLSFPPTVQLRLRLMGSLLSSFLTKEGVVLQLSGRGKVLLQTRSVRGLAQWLNPRFW